VRIGRLQRCALRLQPCDLVRDVILERLDREVGQGDLVVAVLPRSWFSKGELTIEQVSAPKPRPGLSPIATP
jgi:hypothetical protein